MALMRHQALGAQRVMMTASDPARVAAAEQVLARDAVLATGFLGRIVGRLKEAYESERWGADPVHGMGRAMTVYGAAKLASDTLLPTFRFLWTLITKDPTPPF